MTEADWLTTTAPTPMLTFLQGKTSDRKLRLFAVACVQRYRTFYPPIGRVLEMCERYADSLVGWTELAAVRKLAKELQREAMQKRVGMGAGAVRDVSAVANPSAFAAAEGILPMVYFAPEEVVCFIHEIFGNPFRPATIDPAWLTSNVVALARSIYDDRALDRLPILADALREAGCENADILTHCRGDGPHVKGCWVVDLLTGRK